MWCHDNSNWSDEDVAASGNNPKARVSPRRSEGDSYDFETDPWDAKSLPDDESKKASPKKAAKKPKMDLAAVLPSVPRILSQHVRDRKETGSTYRYFGTGQAPQLWRAHQECLNGKVCFIQGKVANTWSRLLAACMSSSDSR